MKAICANASGQPATLDEVQILIEGEVVEQPQA
jgi:hypothetical protein